MVLDNEAQREVLLGALNGVQVAGLNAMAVLLKTAAAVQGATIAPPPEPAPEEAAGG
jgi:hypothetical protein